MITRDRDSVAKARQQRSLDKTMGRFKVATLTPTFTVYLDGSTTAVEAEWIVGLTYIVGTTGTYTLRQGQVPTCWPTKRGAYP